METSIYFAFKAYCILKLIIKYDFFFRRMIEIVLQCTELIITTNVYNLRHKILMGQISCANKT